MRTSFVVVIAVSVASAFLAGCFIITGSTDGYSPVVIDSGSASDGGVACAPDAACVEFGCLGSSDCDAGNLCCLTSAGGALASVCQANCLGPQLCSGGGTDCNGTTCTSQSCTNNGISLAVNACGNVPGCTP